MTKDEALDLALEALDWISRVNAMDYEYQQKAKAAITAIKQARSAPVQGPVAWMDVDEKGAMYSLRFWSEPDNRHEVALYTTPPAAQRPWVGLDWKDMPDIRAGDHAFLAGARWAEDKLKDKNGV